MKELLRILRFVRPYWWALAGSVVLMALVGRRTGPSRCCCGRCSTGC